MRYLNKKPLLLLLSFPFLLMSCEIGGTDLNEVELLRGLVQNDWHIQQTGINGNINDIFFLDDQTGWAVGFEKLIYTEDGGTNWKKLGPPIQIFEATIFFSDPSNGWIHTYERLHRTTDGGKSWSEVFQERNILEFEFLNSESSWAISLSETFEIELLVTKDGWETWDVFDTPELGTKIQFLNEQVGWVVGFPINVFRTEDGGKTWDEKRPTLTEIPEFSVCLDAFFIDENTGWILGRSNDVSFGTYLLKTSNGGQNWDFQKLEIDAAFLPGDYLRFVNEQEGWIVGYQGGEGVILTTSDGGTSWKKELLLTDKRVTALYVSENKDIWIGGERGLILHNRKE